MLPEFFEPLARNLATINHPKISTKNIKDKSTCKCRFEDINEFFKITN